MRSTSDKTFTEQARREQIVMGATTVIAEIGYAATSVAKIADHVGIAKSVVLYHFKTKDDIIAAVVTDVFTAAAAHMLPALTAAGTPSERLGAYIRSNVAYIDGNRVAALALLEIVTGYRSPAGLRLDQVADPGGDNPMDPEAIFAEGVASKAFRPLSPTFMKNALRAALDGAVWELARNPEYDVLGYGDELATTFDMATRRPR